jgi:hypothetical protein
MERGREFSGLYVPITRCSSSPIPFSSNSRWEPKNFFLMFFLKEEAFLAAFTLTLLDRFDGEVGGEYLIFSAVACKEGTERDRIDLLLPGPVTTCSDLFTAVGCLTMLLPLCM